MEFNVTEMGLRIKNCRKAKHITQEKLAELIDVSSHYIYEIESGKKNATIETLAKLTVVLSTSLDYLVFGMLPSEMDYVYTDELNKLLIEVPTSQRKIYADLVKLMQEFKNM